MNTGRISSRQSEKCVDFEKNILRIWIGSGNSCDLFSSRTMKVVSLNIALFKSTVVGVVVYLTHVVYFIQHQVLEGPGWHSSL